MTIPDITYHKWARYHEAMQWVRLGWLPLPSLDGTTHGIWSVHLAWICECPAPSPFISDGSKRVAEILHGEG